MIYLSVYKKLPVKDRVKTFSHQNSLNLLRVLLLLCALAQNVPTTILQPRIKLLLTLFITTQYYSTKHFESEAKVTRKLRIMKKQSIFHDNFLIVKYDKKSLMLKL